MSLDALLLSRWSHAASEGVMRTNVDDTMRRRIPGELGLVIQFNPSHLKSKRPVDKQLLVPPPIAEPAQPKTSAFNFTKARRNEFLSGLCFVTADEQRLPSVQAVEETEEIEKDAEHFVLVNVAPLVRGHILVVPDLNCVRPQKMTKAYLTYALSITQSIQRNDFALGFNSAGAWSSVNHFHLQGYYFPQVERATNFPVAAQRREEMFRVDGGVVKSLPQWKTTCYAIEPEDPNGNALHVVETAWALLELLQGRGVPHNLLVVGMVVFIFPRQAQQENGVNLFSTFSAADADGSPVHPGRLRIAVAELSGLVIAGDSVAYENLTEEMFNSILQTEVSLSVSEQAELVSQWKEKLVSK
ncbi:hypothetical protein PRNP1_006809 [Phytophthora ramorum]